MGLLDFLNTDDGRLGVGLLAAGGYQPTPMSFGQRVNQALGGADELKSTRLKQKLQQQQLDDAKELSLFEAQKRPLVLDDARLKNLQGTQLSEIIRGLLAPETVAGAAPAAAVTTPSTGLLATSDVPTAAATVAPTAPAVPATAPPAQPGGASAFDKKLKQTQALSLIDPARGRTQLEALKLEYPDLGEHDGVLYNKRTGQVVSTMPKATATGEVIQLGQNPDGSFKVTVPQGANDALRGNAEVREAARAKYDPVTVPPTAPNQPPTFRSRLDVLGLGAQPAPTAPTGAPGLVPGIGGGSLPTEPMIARPPRQQAALNAAMANDAAGIPTNFSETQGELARQPAIGRSPAPVLPNAAGMSPNVATEVKGRERATEKKAELDATKATDFEQKIPVLASTVRSLDRLAALTKDDKTYSSAGAELKTQMGSIAQGLGVKIMVGKTANSEEYLARFAELLKERLSSKDYGSGTGVSNLDLLAASKPLPQLVNTPQGRVQIIAALRADANRALTDAQALRDHFRENRELSTFRFPSEVKRSADDIRRQYGVTQ